MSESPTIDADERDRCHIFLVDLPPDAQGAFVCETRKGDQVVWPLRDALPVDYLDSDFVENFDRQQLQGGTWSDYIRASWRVPAAELAPFADLLDVEQGKVVLIGSAAFGGFAVTLDPKPPLRHVASLPCLPAKTARIAPEPIAATQPVPPPPAAEAAPRRASDAAMSGRIAVIALVVMLGLVAAMILIAG